MPWRAGGLRLFGWYVLASALPIALLGGALANQYQTQMDHRALDQATSEADAIANAGIEPVLHNADLTRPIGAVQRTRLADNTRPLLESGSVLRLRIRDRSGVVVFDPTHPRQGRVGGADDEAEAATGGHIVRKLTRLNRDQVDSSNKVGARAVEAYIPIDGSGPHASVIGVLEIYLPYAPIARSFAASNRVMSELIAIGLVALWLALSGISWSVTRRLRRSAAANEHLALHDLLTGLPNRTLFGDRVAHAVASARRSGQPVGITIADLDGFKEVNDALGHQNGDEYLRHVATALADALRPGDTIARLGGDEFGLVLPGLDATTAHTVLERVQRTLAIDVELAGVPISSEATIGIAFWPTDSTDVDELLQYADLAVHAAKDTHQSVLEYTSNLAHFSPERLALVSQLRHAITADELVLHYQPKIDLRTNRIVSVEALLRWQHPNRGLLAPVEFLDVAESTGLIEPLTDWVLEHAIAQVARWEQSGLSLKVAVNVSARNLRNETLVDRVIGRLGSAGVAASSLEIEITETAIVADPVRARGVLQRLCDLGVRISLDDFGQRYTSLAQLGTLPLAELKIDRSFVGRMLVSPHDRAIVTTVIELGHSFGLEVVAEGAETADILAALAALGCDTAQGYALTRALPADEITIWIDRYARGVPSAVTGS